MLSENQKEILNLIEKKLSGLEKDDAILFHISVERKIGSVDFWFQNAADIAPSFIQSNYGTSGTEVKSEFDIGLYLIKISAYIDAFFMGCKSALDCFAHVIRSLYGLGGHSGDLYFEDVLNLMSRHHGDSKLNLYFVSLNIKDKEWYKDLKAYRKASAHESIVPITPTASLDYITGQWKMGLLKLPIDPFQRPLAYNGKNFIDTGKKIKESIYELIIGSYNEMLLDIRDSKTKITP